MLNRILQRISRLFHKHTFNAGEVALPKALKYFPVPYLEICECGATRMKNEI